MTGGQSESLVPTKMDTFEPFGFFKDLKKILTSRLFAPVYITGDTGNGKTTMIEQACAQLGRELYRVNITAQTDEDDLLGGFRLINGETVWSDGPVVRAMKSGAVLLLDEIDYGSELMSCLQSVLEGKGVFLKKIGQFVKPAAGFNILATANTKGKGSESGRFANTNVLNEAFLDRFDWTVENDYPTEAIEKKILKANMNKFGKMDEDFATQLTVWAGHVRKAFKEEAIDDNISTRRLVNICKAFSIFGEREEAVKMSLARFSEESATELWRLYTKVDANAVNNVEEGGTTDDCPFE
jgi:MoxR-like ATPase